MRIYYFTTDISPGQTRIDAVYQDDPPVATPAASDVLFFAIGTDAEDAKSRLIGLAKDAGEVLVAQAEERAEGTALAVRELTT